MKQILLISTGGTIASTPGENGLTPMLQGQALAALVPGLNELCELSYQALLNLDSTNIQPEEWALIAREAYQGMRQYDGVVITHGTDTMAYTAAALSQMLRNPSRPVVFTGSQLPINAPGTDAKRNLYDAIVTAANAPAGVFLVFDGLVIDGARASKVYSANFAAFASVNRPPVGRVREGKFLLEHSPAPPDGAPSLDDRCDPRVTLFKLIPGFDPTLLDAARSIKTHGVILEVFGAGGVPCMRRDLLPAIERLIEAGIPVAAVSQCLYDGCDLGLYDVGRRALEAGVIPTGDMGTEGMVAVMMTSLGRTDDPAALDRALKRDRG